MRLADSLPLSHHKGQVRALGGTTHCSAHSASEMGQTEKNSVRANVFRVTLKADIAQYGQYVSKVPGAASTPRAMGSLLNTAYATQLARLFGLRLRYGLR